MKPRKVGLASCIDAGPIILDLASDDIGILWAKGGSRYVFASQLDDFAVADGFGDWDDLKDFWRETHDERVRFEGYITQWGDTFRPFKTGDGL
jgi:hypothetical protein